jgi:hypothetical protein
VFWNTFAAPSGGMFSTLGRWLDGVRSDNLVTALPPLPDADGVSRNTFIPVPVVIDPPPGLPVRSAVVEFGYVENGAAGGYYCTSRQETCVAASALLNVTTPFSFEQTETYAPVSCAHGCTITIPAISQRALYYRWKYFDASGQVLASSNSHVILTP